jgi:hypothetical protein
VPEVPPAELRRIRAGYLTGYHSAERAEITRQFTERDQALEANRDGQYVLWFEADLYDHGSPVHAGYPGPPSGRGAAHSFVAITTSWRSSPVDRPHHRPK